MKKNIIKIAIILILIAVLVLIGIRIIAFVTNILGNADSVPTERDPMFAEPMIQVTRPPEIDMEQPQPEHPTLDDIQDDVLTPITVK